MGAWFREAETESEIVEPNREASIGYLAYMVNSAYIRRYIVYSILDAEQSGKL